MKQYTRPEIEIITNVLTNAILADSNPVEKPLGDDYFRWGNGQNEHGNSGWVNEGYSDPLEMGGDDNGTIDSRAKSGNMWDD